VPAVSDQTEPSPNHCQLRETFTAELWPEPLRLLDLKQTRIGRAAIEFAPYNQAFQQIARSEQPPSRQHGVALKRHSVAFRRLGRFRRKRPLQIRWKTLITTFANSLPPSKKHPRRSPVAQLVCVVCPRVQSLRLSRITFRKPSRETRSSLKIAGPFLAFTFFTSSELARPYNPVTDSYDPSGDELGPCSLHSRQVFHSIGHRYRPGNSMLSTGLPIKSSCSDLDSNGSGRGRLRGEDGGRTASGWTSLASLCKSSCEHKREAGCHAPFASAARTTKRMSGPVFRAAPRRRCRCDAGISRRGRPEIGALNRRNLKALGQRSFRSGWISFIFVE